jgi:hypothetical protein
MLLELAAANAAFSVIKEAVQNSGSILDAAGALSQYFDSKSSLQKKVNEKGGNKSDLQEWIALQQLEAWEKELREMLIYSNGPPGQWDSWLAFQADAKRKRDDEAKALALAAYKRKQNFWAWINGFLIIVSVLTGVIMVAGVVWVIYTRGPGA